LIICDTGPLIAVYGRNQPVQSRVQRILTADPGPLVVSPFVLAQLDYMIVRDAGVGAELQVLADVGAGTYKLADFTEADIAHVASVVSRYRDMKVGLADASIVVLAARYQTTRVLTFNERHFRAMRPVYGDAFTILPADDRVEIG
jgi:uncharacterized protein